MFSANAPSLLTALDQFRVGLVRRHGEAFAAEEVDHVSEGVRMLQSLFPPKDKKAADQYRLIADGLDTNIRRLVAMAADIDEKEKNDLA